MYRLKQIERTHSSHASNSWLFVKGSIADKGLIVNLFKEYRFDIVVNLAAQAVVRYSIENPDVYIESNIIGFYNILEVCRHYPVQHLVYASSSSVYGGNKKVPFSTDDRVDNPVSLYAATKRSNELMAHCYSKLYNIPSTGLRFFTVYGPAGRPDMAFYLFDTSSRKKFDELVETVSDTLTHFFHSCNLTRVAVPIEDIDKRIEDLSVIVTLYGSHISVTATNAASIVEQFNNEFDYALHQAKTDEDKADWMQRSVMTKQKIENMRNKANPYRDEMQAEVEKYCGWMKQLYGMEFFTFKVQ